MNVVFHAADTERWTTEVLASSEEIIVDSFANRTIAQKGNAAFGRVHNVQIDLGDGLRHGHFPRGRGEYNAFGVAKTNVILLPGVGRSRDQPRALKSRTASR